MKKVIAIFLTAIMLVGCSSGVSQAEYDKLKVDYDTVVAERDELKNAIAIKDNATSTKANIGEYKFGDYKKYNSFASENGLGKDKIYVIGTIDEVKTLNNSIYAYIRQSDGYEWLFPICEMTKYDLDIKAFATLFQSKEITVCGQYMGYSALEQRPGISFEKIILDGKEYGSEDIISEKKESASTATSGSSTLSNDGTSSQTANSDTSNSSNASKPIVKETMGQKNALASAKAYLNYAAFSYQGLIEQLEYEKFPREDAIYGADNCGANWKEQAAKSAKAYLEYTSFSRDGLIEQLEYEGFTYEQAVYGVEQNGY